jgi:heterodisulfide reductase subunit C2
MKANGIDRSLSNHQGELMNEAAPTLTLNGRETVWARAVAGETGIQVASCYQCLRCSNSCPVSTFMDIKPHQVVRLVQLGRRETLLKASSIWVCLSCEMCSTYCPNEIDVAGLMNHLKNSVVSSRRTPAEYEIAAFHDVFLKVLKANGRINDLQLMQRYKLKTLLHGQVPSRGELMSDAALALDLIKRKRLRFLPEKSAAAGEIRQILEDYGHKKVST